MSVVVNVSVMSKEKKVFKWIQSPGDIKGITIVRNCFFFITDIFYKEKNVVNR